MTTAERLRKLEDLAVATNQLAVATRQTQEQVVLPMLETLRDHGTRITALESKDTRKEAFWAGVKRAIWFVGSTVSILLGFIVTLLAALLGRAPA